MNNSDISSPLRVESAPAPTESITSLGSLRALRLSKGLSVSDVSTRLKFSARLIEALEAERLESLPKGLALQSLLRNYAKLLGIDSKQLEISLQTDIGRVQGGIANHTSTRTLGPQHAEHSTRVGVWVWLGVIFLVVATVLGIAVWQSLLPAAWVPTWLEALIK